MIDNHKLLIEKVVIFIVEDAFDGTPIECGKYPSLDEFTKKGQSGFLSTFNDSTDVVPQLVGSHYYTENRLSEILGPMKLAVLKRHSKYNGFGDSQSILDISLEDIYIKIEECFTSHDVIIVELDNLSNLNYLISKLLPNVVSENHAICAICGYQNNVKVPTFPTPPIVDPSWKIIGPDVVESLSVEHPMLYVSLSKQLTRVDYTNFFSEKEISEHCGMGVMPICQLFREFSYYTGSTWKYGA
ncbi:hypothetical protein TRFO_01937 [Tritrichomonas foetus]|uniref:Uncharacterized protein n=1 Tax=Tritrichomonas foetus TaxID=1144522 RepID=A0A1J4JMS8_9EUKA|nr:hypothetical protein TRFO_01937 [Tritrichomonas foetus]|eukprot:OHS98853.1 hypothetical protein TRFO_01937 [Tritrichomonas foetus]